MTAAGQVLRAEAEKLFDIEHRARQMVAQADRGEDVGHLGIGLTAISAIELVPDMLRRFSERVPGVLYSLRENSSEAMLQSLLRNELDVAILRPPVTDPRLQARRLMSEPYVLAVPTGHPLVAPSPPAPARPDRATPPEMHTAPPGRETGSGGGP